MPGIVITGELYKATLYCSAGDQIAENVLHFRANVTAGNPPQQEAANDLSTAIATPLRALMAQDAAYEGLSIQRVSPQPTLDPTWSVSGQGNGTAAVGEILPRQVCGLLTKGTGIAKRWGRGRMYVPFPSEPDSSTATGLPTAGYVTRLETLASLLTSSILFTDGVNSGSWTQILLGTQGQITVLTMRARKEWATQRRRGSFGATNLVPSELA